MFFSSQPWPLAGMAAPPPVDPATAAPVALRVPDALLRLTESGCTAPPSPTAAVLPAASLAEPDELSLCAAAEVRPPSRAMARRVALPTVEPHAVAAQNSSAMAMDAVVW